MIQPLPERVARERRVKRLRPSLLWFHPTAVTFTRGAFGYSLLTHARLPTTHATVGYIAWALRTAAWSRVAPACGRQPCSGAWLAPRPIVRT